MQAMILAAGFGTRLLPHTSFRPKPLFPVLNQPLLLLTIKRLQRFGCDPIVVNCHHLAHQIIEAVSRLEGVIVQKEETILGTGGGLRLAASSFRNEPVLITNSDIYHTIDIRALYHFHNGSRGEVSLAMHNEPRFNSVEVIDDRVVAFDNTKSASLSAFTGLHVVNRDLLREIPGQCFYSIIDLYKRMLAQGRPISVTYVDDCYWTDMGTVADYLSLHGRLLMREVKLWREFGNINESPFLLADGAEYRGEPILRDWACVGSARIGRDVVLERTVVWDGAVIPDHSSFRGCIVSS